MLCVYKFGRAVVSIQLVSPKKGETNNTMEIIAMIEAVSIQLVSPKKGEF